MISPRILHALRGDGQKVLLSVRAMGGESEAVWRAVLNRMTRLGMPMSQRMA